MADKAAKVLKFQTFKRSIFDTTIAAELAEKKMKEYFKTTSSFRPGLKIARIEAHNAQVRFFNATGQYGIKMKILEIYFAQAYAETCNQEFFLVKDFYEDSFTVPSLGKTTSQEAKEICGSRHLKILDVEEVPHYKKLQEFVPSPQHGEKCGEFILSNFKAKSNNSCLSLPPIFSHGDLWSCNVLWRNKVEIIEIAGIIDWQVS
ncbi:unnamed protein product [Enterobius vermicularis]|uniref:CHK domain-containing protein n=1 Tax=Enterobius vermicularis TaxID=51028 RepID=A0A0N4VAN9_ENTVE|nr:unnamed protein product [Enterobius vermicularis]